MIEADWDICTDPTAMLECVRISGKTGDHKLRLFAGACCRLIWHLMSEERARMAVQVAECYADGLPTGHDIIRTYCDTNALLFPLGRRYTPWVPAEVLDAAYTAVLRTVSQSGCYYGQKWEYREYDACQCAGDAVARVTRVVASPDQVVT